MLDHTDIRILDELGKNSRITMKELSEKVHMTGQATADRIAKLEDGGVIEGYTIQVNQVKLGYSIHAFIDARRLSSPLLDVHKSERAIHFG